MRTLCLALALLVAPLVAQEAAAPVLPNETRLTLQLLDATAENLQLRLALVTAERAKMLESLKRNGYTLQQGPNGWAYFPVLTK